MGPVPRNVVMLTADAYGVLPPIAKLTPDQAMYHFLSGYTARVAGTEIGVTEPEATFSTCFGAPFMPRHPSVYGNLLKERIAKGGVDCWLVNTGWTGGKYGVGHAHADQGDARAAQRGARRQPQRRRVPHRSQFRLQGAGRRCRASISAILDPRETWANKAEYDATAAKLVDLFVENFAQFADACRRRGATSRAPRNQPPKPPESARQRSGLSKKARPMTDHSLRFFADDAAVRRSGRGCSRARCPRPNGRTRRISPRASGCCVERPDIDPERDLRTIISRYNESVGGVNDDTQGYHDTITHDVRGRRARCISATGQRASRWRKVNALLARPRAGATGRSRFYPRDRLFSVEARRKFVAPDLVAAPS